ncbi:MAG: hypothetical protein MJ252_26330 [archaeon]|nr:hypothetical protein [archaeon]
MDDAKRKARREELAKLRLQKERKLKQIEQLKAHKGKEEDNKKSELEKAKEMIKESKVAENENNPEEAQKMNKIKEEMKKKQFLESLQIVKTSETFVGLHPECYDEMVQCEEEKDEKSDKSSDEGDDKMVQQKKTFDHLIVKKKRVVEGEKKPIDISTIKVNVIEGAERKEIMEKKKVDLYEFMKKEKNFIEKALTERTIVDLFGKVEDEEDKNQADGEDNIKEEEEKKDTERDPSKVIHPLCEFYGDSTRKRVVTALEMSTNYREMLLAAYSKADEFDFNQKSGLIHLWSFALRNFPEFTYTCQSEVTSAIMNPFNPNIVIGGTHSGQVFLWDIRGKALPCSKSPFGVYNDTRPADMTGEVKTHSSRIECLAVVGNINASNIISISDGILCKWSQNRLDKPVKIIDLKRRKVNQEKKVEISEMGVLSLGYITSESNNILIGSDDNNIYQVSLIGNEAAEKPSVCFKGHEGPIHSIDIHPPDIHNKCNFGSLFLTSSGDWTNRIFSKNQKDGPLITLDTNDDYVYTSRWCPNKPSVFACGDGGGNLDFWDLNYSLEEPKYRYKTGEDVVNKLIWSEDARRLIYGNSSGKINVLSLSKKIYKSKTEDSLKFEEILNENKMK